MGKRTWLDELINTTYLPQLKRLQNTPEGIRVVERLNSEIRQSWSERNLASLKQQQGCMDQLRSAIKKALGDDHFSLEYIKFSTEEYVALNNEKQGQVAERNEQIKFLDNPDAIVNQAVRLLNSPEWAEVTAGLALLTGRRVAELLSTAKFEKRSKWSVTFTGALKRRGERETLSFEIPVLTTADKVISALAKIRHEVPEAVDLPPERINASYQGAVVTACDKHFTGLIPTRDGRGNLYTHGQMAVYATIAVFWYCPPWVNETEYKAAIQGHYQLLDEANPQLRRSIAASRHYSDYEIADTVVAEHQGKRKGIKLGYAGIEPIEIFRKKQVETKEQIPTDERRRTASLRIWDTDRSRLDAILKRLSLDNGVQQYRISELLTWIESELDGDRKPIPLLPSPIQAEEPQQLEPETVEEEAVAVPPPAISAPLEAQLGLLVQTMTSFVEMQKELIAAPAQTKRKQKASHPVKESTLVEASEDGKQSDDDSKQEEKEPRETRHGNYNSESDTLINQAIDGIIAWNDEPNRRHADKWAITINALKGFIQNQRKIIKILAERTEEISAHHEKHKLNKTHNQRHRGVNITEIIAI